MPSLDASDEQRLAVRVQQRDEEALMDLARSQLALVVQYARRYAHLGVPLLDLVHDGNLALLEAARRFQPGRAERFAASALWWVRQAVLHRVTQGPGPLGFADEDGVTGRLAVALAEAVEQAGRLPDEAGSELSAHDVRMLDEQWRRVAAPLPLGSDEDFDLDELAPLVSGDEADPLRQALASDLETSLLELEPKERRALELRLGLIDGEPRSVDQVSDRLRVSAARAERLSQRAVGKLRRQRAWRSPLN